MPIVGAPSTSALVVLDPVTEDAANVEVELSGNYGLLAHAYPTPPVSAQWASSVSTEGAVLSSIRHENRTITLTVEATGLGALYDLEQKIGKLYREGGTYKLVYSDGRAIVFDVLTVSNYDPTFEALHHFGGRTPVVLTFECKPYGRGAEITLSDHVETTLPVLVFTETSIPGDMPALGRLVIDNDTATAQGLEVWGVQSRYYDSSAAGALFYEAEACSMGIAAAAVGPAGASGSTTNKVARTTTLPLAPSWSLLHFIGGGLGSHIGTFRVFARVQAPVTNGGIVRLRLAWLQTAGDATGTLDSGRTVYNTGVDIALSGSATWTEGLWLLVDLGTVTIPKATVGTQGWMGYLQGQSTLGGDDVDVDWVALFPVDEGYGESVQTSVTGSPPVLASGSFQVAHNGVTATGTVPGYWRTPDKYEGGYLLVPPSGPEGRSVRVIAKLARNVVTVGAVSGPQPGPVYGDSAIDDLSARLYVTPRFLVVPSA